VKLTVNSKSTLTSRESKPNLEDKTEENGIPQKKK